MIGPGARRYTLACLALASLLLVAGLFSARSVSATGGPRPGEGERRSAAFWEAVLREVGAASGRVPEQPEGLFWSGVAFANLGRIEDSRSAFQRLDALDPARLTLERVARQCRATLAQDQSNLKAHNGLAFLAYATGEYAEAAQRFGEVVRQDPDNPWVRAYWGYALGKSGRLDEAVRVLEEAVQRFPENEILHFVLGLAYYYKGWLAKALGEMAKAPGAIRYFR